MVGLEGVAVGTAEGGRELLRGVGQIGAEGLSCEVEAAVKEMSSQYGEQCPMKEVEDV